MNDLREAIDRVGARFEPPPPGLDDLAGRRNRARARRRVAAGAFALAVAAAGSLVAVRAFTASSPAPGATISVGAESPSPSVGPSAAPSRTETGPSCPSPTGESPPQIVLSSRSAPAGSTVEVSGTFGSAELWLQLWWNARDMMPDTVTPPPWPPTGPDLGLDPAGPGPVVRLLAVAGPPITGDCTFSREFTVPDVEPGTYQLVWVAGGLGETTEPILSAYALRSSHLTFQVTG
jgi:hypothetical protein